ncbi:glycosyltransferase family 9 protein [Lacimicrobium alkaliphilum]|uniref:Uncharacterized protein n=1 Tax=Lacimicrobium alkaliphilum TaxID=1526571 RepID=A0ABQ1RK25_9ALTE|nr:hypothetical protein [Lacimicrobium alkaliphilum]GGD72406.1 hypothetical protein GCM10011357_29260 [Lacimicrobium alkaliphilum]
MNQEKVLLIRMQQSGEVAAIGIPALRYFRQRLPEASIEMLSYAKGIELIRLAEPDIRVFGLGQQEWPDNIIPAMETFLGLAEKIVAQGYDQIVNLDTGFMPCFLARFLKDAGEPVVGNFMNITVQELLEQFQTQQLSPEYVNQPQNYMSSTFLSMARWHSPWWQGDLLPDNGYPEFYLRSCCGFDDLEMELNIDVPADKALKNQSKTKKVIALQCEATEAKLSYPFKTEMEKLLREQGFYVWTVESAQNTRNQLMQLKASDLLVTVPGDSQWLASTVSCPSLVICGDVDPRMLMPDYATDPVTADNPQPIAAAELAESITSVFEQENDNADR